MVLGIMILAMLISGIVAVAAFLVGYSFWMALVIYSGIGFLVVLTATALLLIPSETKESRAKEPQQRGEADPVVCVSEAAPPLKRPFSRNR